MVTWRRVLTVVGMASLALAQDAPQTDVLRGVVVDGQGAPVAGLAIDVLRRDGGDFTCLDLEFGNALRKVATLRTGKSGTFAVQVQRGLPYELRADDGVHAPLVCHDAQGGEDLRLTIAPSASFVVAVVDAAGAPFAGGGFVHGFDGRGHTLVRGPLDAQGVFRSGRLPAGVITIAVEPRGASRPDWKRLDLAVGAEAKVDLAVAPGFVARGRVTDAVTGRPIVGARVGEGWTLYQTVLTDADGRYELRGFGAPTGGELHVRAPGYGAALLRPGNVTADLRRDFALEPGTAARGRVLAVDGAPVSGAYVAAVGFADDEANSFDWCPGRTDAEGRYELTGLRPSVSYALLVMPVDGVRLTYDLPRGTPGKDLAVPDVRLRGGRCVAGRVVDDTGAPVVGLPVVLRGANQDRGTLLGAGVKAGAAMRSMVDNYVATRAARSDTDGRIHFANVAPGSYVMEWFAGRARDSVAIEVVAAADPAPVSFTLVR